MDDIKKRKRVTKLACDRCDMELTEPMDIELALEGMKAWQASCRAQGVEPRGVYPCKNYVRCCGEMIAIVSPRRWVPNFFGPRKESLIKGGMTD